MKQKAAIFLFILGCVLVLTPSVHAQASKLNRAVRTADDGTPLAAGAGRYEYPHDRADGIGTQDYLGVAKRYYRPTDRGLEKAIGEHLERVRATRRLAQEER